jgi:hypothetical protein
MDHGVLNVPLAKRGDVDKQIDRYKEDVAKAAKAKARDDATVKSDLVVSAKAHVEQLTEQRISELAKRFGKTSKQTKKWLLAQAFWQPSIILKL